MSMRGISQRQQQHGSVPVVLLVLVVIGLAVWYFAGGRIKQALSFGSGSKEPLVELVELRSGGVGALGGCKGTVRNLSGDPMQLSAFVLVKHGAGGLPDERMRSNVNPFPLPPGQTGTFEIETQFDAAKDECVIQYFSDGDRRLGFRKADGR